MLAILTIANLSVAENFGEFTILNEKGKIVVKDGLNWPDSIITLDAGWEFKYYGFLPADNCVFEIFIGYTEDDDYRNIDVTLNGQNAKIKKILRPNEDIWPTDGFQNYQVKNGGKRYNFDGSLKYNIEIKTVVHYICKIPKFVATDTNGSYKSLTLQAKARDKVKIVVPYPHIVFWLFWPDYKKDWPKIELEPKHRE